MMTRLITWLSLARRAVAAIGEGVDRAWRWTMASTPVLPQLQRPYLVVMPLLFAGTIGVAASVLPGEAERIASFERDGEMRKALGMLEQRYRSGDRSSRTMFELHRMYDYYGDTEKARVTLEQLAEQRPRDAVIQRQLAQLYRSMQDEPAYLRALGKQVELRYSEPACREIIGIHRRNSNYAEEQATIKQCRGLGYRRPDDLIRLAFLEAADGNMAETAETLTAVDDRKWLREIRDRQLLFASLLDVNRPEEAMRRSVRWMRGRLDHELAVDFAFALVEVKRPDLALQLASSVSQPGDAVALAVGEIMNGQSQQTAARAFLRGWLGQAQVMTAELTIRFVNAALGADEPGLALEGAQKFGLAKMEQGQLDILAETLIASARGREFDVVRQHLASETIVRNPMLAAGIDLRLGRNEQARNSLLRVRLDDLDDRRLAHFARLVDQAGRSPALAAVLREPRLVAVTVPSSPGVVGPAQKQARQGILKRAEANKKVREKRKADAKKAAAPLGITYTPFSAPTPQ